MTDALPLDLTNKEQFPVIAGLVEKLASYIPKTYIPHGHDGSSACFGVYRFAIKRYREDYLGRRDHEVVSEEERNMDITEAKHEIRDYVIRAAHSPYIDQLVNEREYYLAINIWGSEQREHCIAAYNQLVISEVESFIDQIHNNHLNFIFNGYFDESHVVNLNLKKYFKKWYNEFGVINTKIKNQGDDKSETEPMPEYEYESIAQKITWLHELGVIDTILNLCKHEKTYNIRRAANVIQTFTEINADTLRKCLSAIYQPASDQKNNPLNNPANKLFVANMTKKFKLNKED
jgi:hypothetical protein